MSEEKKYRNGQYEGHGYDLWTTPPHIIEELREEFGPMFDPCPENWDESFNGLEIEWKKVNFVNPPYSQMVDWIKKSHEEWKKGKTVILLIPPRTDTRYFHDYVNGNAEVRFIKGRLKFGNPSKVGYKPTGAPFPSILCVFKGDGWMARFPLNVEIIVRGGLVEDVNVVGSTADIVNSMDWYITDLDMKELIG